MTRADPSDARYVPAARWHALTRLYDPIVAATMRERLWRERLAELAAAGLPDGGTLVDVGCGTGTFAVAFARRRPDARVVGVDGDPDALALAGAKQGAGAVDWRRGLAAELPLTDGSADVVSMSLLLHHLVRDAKHAALVEARRVLHPGGLLCVADWGRPRGALARAGFGALRLIDGRPQTADHAAGRLPAIVATAGFGGVACDRRVHTAFGSLELLTATSTKEA